MQMTLVQRIQHSEPGANEEDGMSVCLSVCMSVYVCVYAYVCMHTCVCVCVCIYTTELLLQGIQFTWRSIDQCVGSWSY